MPMITVLGITDPFQMPQVKCPGDLDTSGSENPEGAAV